MADQVRLRDGTEAWVWPLQHSDRDRFAEEFEKLSPEILRQRFLSPVVHLTDALLTSLVDEVDGVDHVALVVLVESPARSRTFEPVAIGRIVRYPDVPDAADVAVTVQQAWQGRGVASALLPVLLAQRPAGVTHLLTSVGADNPASLALMRHAGRTTVQPTGTGILDVRVDLNEPVDPAESVGSADPSGPVDPSGPGSDDVGGPIIGERLHPALTGSWRVPFRGRDSICPWLQ